eukprot:TRINITY_DN30360_c0_g1_i1.p1 TRINITY_DN30360_c0_g1~~TRINITY_DN30360_c0_g1_i1.p1  ORF type:complete len:559 (-),score=85.48 TRINITY_DN30360_c0_g1_i1:27-1652(-)
MLLALPVSSIIVPCRPIADDDWRRNADLDQLSTGTRQEWEKSIRVPFPPLSLEAVEATRTLRDESASADAVILAARTLSLFHEAASPHAALLARRLSDERSDVRRVMAYALGQVGPAAACAHAPALVDCLWDGDAGVQMILKNLLSATGRQGAEALAAKIAAEDSTASKSAMQILSSMGSEGAAALAAQLPQLEASANRRIIASFMRIGKAGFPHLESVAALLNHSDAAVRRDATEAVGRCRDAAGPYAPVIARLLQEGDAAERCCALEALERIGRPAGAYMHVISGALCDADTSVQLKAVKAIGGIAGAMLNPDPLTDCDEGAWAVPDDAILAMLCHFEQQTPNVIESLKLMGCWGAAILATQLTKSVEAKRRSLEALVAMGPRDRDNKGISDAPRELHVGACALACYLNAKEPAMRLMVCGALGSCGVFARGHAWTLKEMWDGNGNAELRDASPEVRKAAMTAITKMNSKKGAETNVLLTDPTIVAMSVPVSQKRDASKLAELIKDKIAHVAQLQATSTLRIPSKQKMSSLGCLPFFRK